MASAEELAARLDAQMGTRNAALAARLEAMMAPQPAPVRPPAEAAVRGAGLGVRDVAMGVAQSLPGLAYDVAALPINAAGAAVNYFRPGTVPTVRSASENVGALADAAGLPVPETTTERAVGGAVRGATGALVSAGAGGLINTLAPAGGALAGVGGAVAASPALQAGAGAVGGAVGEGTGDPLLGIAAGVAAPIGAGLAARAITPITNNLSPGRAALVAAAQREGIPLSTGQVTGSRVLQNMEGSFAQLPGTSGAEAAFAERQRQAFNRAVLRRAGENADSAEPAVLNAARARIGAVFDDLSNRNTLRVDDELMARLATLEDDVSRFAVPEIGGPVRERMRQLVGQVDADGNVPGAFYRQMDSALGRTARSTTNGDLRDAVGELRDTLRNAMDASITPDDSAAWQEARRQYAALMTAARATSGAGAAAAEGNISPLALQGAVRRGTGRDFAFGDSEMHTLARVGQSVLRAPPDSGTAGRTAMNALLTGSGPAGGGTLGALIGGPVGAGVGAVAGLALPAVVRGVYNTPAMSAYLRNQTISPALRNTLSGWTANALTEGMARERD